MFREILEGKETVKIKKLPKEHMNFYGVSVSGEMTFSSGFSNDKLFLKTKNGHYVETKKDGVTYQPGNGMSGTSTIYFNYDKKDKVIKILEKNGYDVA